MLINTEKHENKFRRLAIKNGKTEFAEFLLLQERKGTAGHLRKKKEQQQQAEMRPHSFRGLSRAFLAAFYFYFYFLYIPISYFYFSGVCDLPLRGRVPLLLDLVVGSCKDFRELRDFTRCVKRSRPRASELL